jgi:signal transduction histidine kinase
MMTVPNRRIQTGDLLALHQESLTDALLFGRLFVAVAALLMASGVVLAVYAALAAALIVLARSGRSLVPDTGMHVVDIAVAVAVASTHPTGPFAILSLYALLAAGIRWGLAEAVLTAAIAVVLLVINSMLAAPVFTASLIPVVIDSESLAVRSTYLLAAGLLVGYLAHRENRLRTEAAQIASLTRCADVRAGLKQTIGSMFAGIARLFGTRRVVLVAWHKASETLVSWDGTVAADGTIPDLRCVRLDAADAAAYLIEPRDCAWHLVRRTAAGGDRFDVVAVDARGRRMKNVSVNVSTPLGATIQPFDTLLGVPIDLAAQDWVGHLFLVNPEFRSDRRSAAAFAVRVVQHLAPAVQNVSSLSLVRASAAAAERGRLARELHDGVIQGVLGVEMHVAALMRRLAPDTPAIVDELGRLNGMLRQEVIALRELLQQMHPVEVDGDQLVDLLTDFVQRFERETGITARLITQLDRVPLAPRACREVARIVGEALVNIRRHSGASHVFVRLSAENGGCHLSIEDDGQGFSFSGRKPHADLDASRQGPFVIKQRVRAIGGELTVDSDPGHGARLEITVPVSSYGLYA